LITQLEEKPLLFISGGKTTSNPQHEPIAKQFYNDHFNCPMSGSEQPCTTKLHHHIILSILSLDQREKYHHRAQNILQSKLEDFKHAEKEREKTPEQKLIEEKASEEFLGKHQRCPKPECNVPIFRFDGCDWIKCPQCTYEFCYSCRGPHDHNMEKHVCTSTIQSFAHLQDGVVAPVVPPV
jgi:hypothetical protein